MAARSAERPSVPQSGPSDPTRAKLLEAGAAVFAEQGFQGATIREICARADANVAAVNYYFRDKLGLYMEVLRGSICAFPNDHLQKFAAPQVDPEKALRLFISGLIHRMWETEGPGKLRIMAHELAHPSPALREVVGQVIRPNYEVLRRIIGAILALDPDHETTRLCAHSVIGQIVHYTHAQPVISILWPGLKLTPKRVEQIADHIANFSLCAMRAQTRQTRKRK